MRCFKFNKPSSTISYPLWHTQLVSTVTKQTKTEEKKKLPKRVRLTKTKLKAMLEYIRVKEKKLKELVK